MARKRTSLRNFSSYGSIEAFNVLLIPGAAIFLAPPGDGVEAAVLGAAILPTAGLLVVGAFFWWAIARRLKGDRSLLQRWLAAADRAEGPLIALLAAAAAACVFGLLTRGLSGPIIAALVLTLLAVLEYVNYYHVQLQHFDNWADFKRLVTTRKFRVAHSARELAAYRRSKRA